MRGRLIFMKIDKHLLILLILVVIGFFTRVYKLSSIPGEMHRDEIAIGYNAYSVLTTGKDEHGAGPFPLIFESYGDYKLPGLIYSSIPAISIFGLNELAVRLPTAILGTLIIPLSYFFLKELSKDKTKSLVAAGLITFSVWGTFLSRTGYEPIAGLTVQLAALLFLLLSRKKPLYSLVSLLLFFISFFFYNLPLLISPFIIVLILIIYRKDFFKSKSKVGSFLFMGFFASIFITTMVIQSNVTSGKAGTTIFSTSEIQEEINSQRLYLTQSGFPSIFARIIAGNEQNLILKFSKNYVAAFDPKYLFFTGGSNDWHNLSGIGLGNLSPVILVFLVVGLYYLAKEKSKLSYFLFGYLLISPVPDALTIDAPVTNRLLDLHFVILIIASIGVVQLFRYRKRVIVILTAAYFGYYLLFISRYYFLYNQTLKPLWLEGTKEMAKELRVKEKDYDEIYINSSGNGKIIDIPTLYSYILFFSAYDPAGFQSNATWSSGNDYHAALSFYPYTITSLSLEDTSLLAEKEGKSILYLIRKPSKNGQISTWSSTKLPSSTN